MCTGIYLSGESQPSREAREKATVGVPGLGNKHVHTAQENSKVEADLGNNVTEPVEEIKYLETMKVFDESPKTKAEPEEHAESARDMAYHSVMAPLHHL